MSAHPDLDAMARRVIDGNLYMTVATLDPGGAPRLSPVYYTPARYTDLYWGVLAASRPRTSPARRTCGSTWRKRPRGRS